MVSANVVSGGESPLLTDEIAGHERAIEDISGRLPASAHSDPEDPALARMRAEIAEENSRFRGRLESLLGPDELRAFDRFEAAAPHWEEVAELARQLYDTEARLAPGPASQLADILIAAAMDANGKVAHEAVLDDEALARAAAVLSPAQFEVFKELQQQRRLQTEVNRLRAKAGG